MSGHFNWADYAIIGIIVFSALISLIRGFVREALSLVTWIAALWLAYKFTPLFSSYLTQYIHSPTIRFVVGFFIIFIVVLIIGALINFTISSLVVRTGLSGSDRVVGLVFGAARGILLIGILVLLAGLTTMPKSAWYEQSQLIPNFNGLSAWLKQILPEQLNQLSTLVTTKTINQKNTDTTDVPQPSTTDANSLTNQAPGH